MIENDAHSPKTEILRDIAKHLETSTDFLLCLSDIKSTDEDIKNVIRVMGLSEEAIKAIKNFTSSEDTFRKWDNDSHKKAFNIFFTASSFFDFWNAFFDLYQLFISPQQRKYKYIDNAIDYMYNLPFPMKVARYELSETLTRLIDGIFPIPDRADLSKLSIEETPEEYEEREKNQERYYNELYIKRQMEFEPNNEIDEKQSIKQQISNENI